MMKAANLFIDLLDGLPGRGSVPASHVIVGIAPSTKRPKHRRLMPFGAASYRVLERLGGRFSSLYVTNLVKDPTAPKTKVLKSTADLWIPRLMIELEMVRPERVLILGAPVAKALIPDFTEMRADHGTFFWNEELECWFIPTYHFAAGQRQPNLRPYLKRDLERFFTLPVPSEVTYQLVGPDDIHPPKGAEVIFDIETTGLENDSQILQIGFQWDGCLGAQIVHKPSDFDIKAIADNLRGREVTLVGHNLPFDLRYMLREAGLTWPRTDIEDTMILAHVQGHTRVGLKHLTSFLTDLPGSHSGGGPDDPTYLAEDLRSTKVLLERLKEDEVPWIYDILCNLVPVVAFMRHRGVHLDLEKLKEITTQIEAETEECRATLLEHSPWNDINWNSPKQVGEVLLAAGVPLSEKTPTGQYSVAEAVLAKLVDVHPAVAAIMTLRTNTKLLSTYCHPYLDFTKGDGLLHPRLLLTGTVTGRLSCRDPNLQQVPRLGPLKLAFTSRWEGGKIGLVDFSQAELRVAALLSEDEAMAQALLSEDVHRFIASMVFGMEQDEITDTLRKASKKVTFGLLYGGSPRGISQRAGLKMDDIVQVLDVFFSQFPDLARWFKMMKRLSLTEDFVVTPFGRKRNIAEVLVAEGENGAYRKAVNTPNQSTASDAMLVVLWGIFKRLVAHRPPLRTRPIFGVHDSLVLEIGPGEEDIVAEIVQDSFKDLWQTPLRDLPLFELLPLVGELKMGPSWASVEETNEGYAPEREWKCTSKGGNLL